MIYGDQEFAQLLKEVIVDGRRHPLYEETTKHAKEMAVHVYGNKPFYLLERARPREDEEVKAYRIENYEPTTKSGSDKSLDIISKIFNPTLYSVRWKDESNDSKELKKYTFEYYPEYNSLINFNKDVLLRKMVADPNGIAAVKPEYIPETSAEKVGNPIIMVYGSKAIWFYTRDFYLINVDIDQENNVDKYYYFDYYDSNIYLRLKCWYEPDYKEIVVEEKDRYNHNFDELPCWKLRGKSKSSDSGEIIYESFLSSALPHWNLAVIHESDLLGAYITHMHPQKYELAEECSFQFPFNGHSYNCRGGRVKYPGGKDGAWIDMDCPTCQGTGFSSVKSPYGAYQFTRQKLDETGGLGGLTPVGYINIPTEATKMLEERTDKMIRKGMWAINMDVEDKVGENQSGAAKVIDRSAQYDTLGVFSYVMFDIHLQNQYYFINKYLFGIEARSAGRTEDNSLPEINRPVMFDIASSSELINNFKIAKESGLNRNFLRVREIEILSRDLQTNPDLKQYLITMLNLDPLPGLDIDQINLAASRGFIRKIDAVINANLKPFMDRAVAEVNGFMEMEKEQKLEILTGYAEELIASEAPQIAPNILDNVTQ